MGEKETDVNASNIGEIRELLTQLGTLTQNMNRFFERSFTQHGRLKVANIPIEIGESREQQEEVANALVRLPNLMEELISELRATNERISQLLSQPSEG